MIAALLATALAATPVIEPLVIDVGAISDAAFLPLPEGPPLGACRALALAATMPGGSA
jgi:hypothetical protein